MNTFKELLNELANCAHSPNICLEAKFPNGFWPKNKCAHFTYTFVVGVLSIEKVVGGYWCCVCWAFVF